MSLANSVLGGERLALARLLSQIENNDPSGLAALGELFPHTGNAHLVGVTGASIVWGSTELKEQAIRAEFGWYAFRVKKIKPPLESIIKKWRAPHL